MNGPQQVDTTLNVDVGLEVRRSVLHRARLSLNPAGEKLEAPPGFEPGVEVLQTSALPLGDGALIGEMLTRACLEVRNVCRARPR